MTDPWAGLDALGGGWQSVTPILQRRKKADGSWEYRAAPREGAGPADVPSAIDPNEHPHAAFGRQVLTRAAEGVAALPEMAAAGTAWMGEKFGEALNLGGRSEEDSGDLPDLLGVDPAGVYGPRGSAPRSIREDLRDRYDLERDKLTERLKDAPVVAGVADLAMDLGSDPTNLIPMGAGKVALRELAEEGLETAAKRVGRSALDYTPSELETLARRKRGMRDLPPIERPPEIPHAGPVGLNKTAADQRRALGMVAGEDADELLRASLELDEHAAPSLPRSFEEVLPPPPRIPLDDLPDPVHFPRAEFEAIADLPPPVSGAIHREAVEQAVQAGERVPPAALESYDDLAAEVTVSGRRPKLPVGGPPLNAEAGFVRIPTGPGFLSRYFRKDGEFAALGELRGWAFDRAGEMRREIAAGKRGVQNTLRDFSSAFEDEVVANGLSPGDALDNVTAYIEGANDGAGLTPRLRTAADAMRQHYDELSEGYLQQADLPQSLRETIELNRGEYHPRIFEGFENPDWKSIVDPTSKRHDPREAWRWDNYMTWAQGQRASDQQAIHAQARVVVNGQEARVVRVGASAREALEAARGQMPQPQGPPASLARPPARPEGMSTAEHNARQWQAGNERAANRAEAAGQRREIRNRLVAQEMEARRNEVLVEFPDQIDPETGDVVRQVVTRDQVQALGGMAQWGDDQLAAYGQRLLDRDPDAFFGVGQSDIGREGRGNLKRRIIQDPRVGDLPTDLAERVHQGQLSMPTAIEQAKQRPGWFAQYAQHAPGLPEELDDLLGLYRDPSQRYRTGAMRAAHDQAVYKMHADLAERGTGSIFFTEDTMRPGFYEKIGGKGPLAELVTSPEIAAVIRGTENTSQQVGPLLNAWRKVNGGAKLAKTALNFPAGHMRNAAAWPFQLMAGGHFGAAFNPARPMQLMKYQLADKLGPKRGVMARMAKRLADTVELADGSRLGERWAMSLDELRPEIEYLYRQGVFGESAAGADIRHYTGAFPTLREPGAVAGARKAISAPLEAGVNFWAGGDDLGKHVYYRAELQNLLWADGRLGMAESLPVDYFTRPEFADAAREAAERTRLTTPTGSMISPGVRAMRDLPIAPFPGWTSEVFRTAKEQVKLGLADLRHANPKRKVLGAQRLSGFMAMSALAGGGLAAGVNKLSGVKDTEGVRSFVPPWSRDSQLAVLEMDPAGKVRYVDASALLPYSAFMDSAGVILRSAADPTDSSWDAALDTAQASLQPYIEEDIIANAVLDFARNRQGGESALTIPLQMLRENERRDSSYPIRTPGASATTQAKQAAYFWWKSLAPSGLAGLQGERLARAATEDNPEIRKLFVEMTNYDRDLEIKDEGLAALGLRVSTTDVGKAVARLGTDYVRQRAEASSLYTRRSRMGAEGVAHPEVILAAKKEANEMGKSAHEQAARVVADAFRLGFNEQRVRLWLKEGNIAKKHREALLWDARALLAGREPSAYLVVVE